MGRGNGGYTTKQQRYVDSGQKEVHDDSAIFVAERYIEMGYESVFRQVHENQKTYDLSIKTSDDTSFVKNIEVKRINSENPTKIARNIKKGFEQLRNEGVVALHAFKYNSNDKNGLQLVGQGIKEAQRKGYVKDKIEVWFKDKKCLTMEEVLKNV